MQTTVRRYLETDRSFFMGLVRDPIVMVAMDGPMSDERSEEIWACISNDADPRCGRVLVDEKDQPLAHLAWHPSEHGDREVTFIVHPAHRGQGLATRGLRWMMDHLPGRLVATVDLDHKVSRRVLEKVGFTLEKTVHKPEDGGVPWCLYARDTLV